MGDISAAEGDVAAPRLLVVCSLNDLKDKVARLVLLVLVIEFFGRALNLDYARALDLLYLAGGILLVSAALYLRGSQPQSQRPPVPPPAGQTGNLPEYPQRLPGASLLAAVLQRTRRAPCSNTAKSIVPLQPQHDHDM